ncbi:putative regulatory protein (CxxC_CxxC_SSSS) [Aeromicrobium marinum DSM 15272]|uniref:Regulatory protein (CxxC_CxxC_SSSS) n=1 Tax=Aeromicrobium marinum DSM 15272 TaxID=585531 RepID=E2SDI7_9ACTN|nr:FmdB family zinc ribbon protein [Aeromicrobium marinum]EFQ82564.1 putative regulatory protein (CxxC_CxxC_SSSS) [Aeromicrobium marinum DSM 15272]
MPTYQYQCTDCGEGLEVQQSFTEDSLTVCPACEGRLRKVFNAVGVVFKGSGFYRNDSRSTTTSSDAASSSTSSTAATPASGSSGSSSAAPAKPAKSSGSGTDSAA